MPMSGWYVHLPIYECCICSMGLVLCYGSQFTSLTYHEQMTSCILLGCYAQVRSALGGDSTFVSVKATTASDRQSSSLSHLENIQIWGIH